MKVWINDNVGFLTGYSMEPVEGLIEVEIDTSHSEVMLGDLLDFHNYYYDGKKVYRNTNNGVSEILRRGSCKAS
ncbi:hypothetical protein EFP29_63 [Enterococcus phage EF-P29]|nr:hypothetical protein EFP29_63 [Enterococcus phage EF-P29]